MNQLTTDLMVFLQAYVVVTKVGDDDEMPAYRTNNSCDFDGCEEIASRMFECVDNKVFGGWTFACSKHIVPVLIGFMGSITERVREW